MPILVIIQLSETTINRETMTMTAAQTISHQILTLIANGMNVIQACEEVLGKDKVDNMITDIYTTLRARTTA